LARDWRQAGLDHLQRRVTSFEASQLAPDEARIIVAATCTATNGTFAHHAIWILRGDGSISMDNRFECTSTLATLPRVGVVLRANSGLTNVSWYGRGPWENYPDRKSATDLGMWRSTVDGQYVPYVRPQENGNKEDVRWLALTDANGRGL